MRNPDFAKTTTSKKLRPREQRPNKKKYISNFANCKKTVTNPVASFADPEKLKTLSHEEKQRYILSLCADYVSVKKYLDEKARKIG